MDKWFNEFENKLTECKIGIGDIIYIFGYYNDVMLGKEES